MNDSSLPDHEAKTTAAAMNVPAEKTARASFGCTFALWLLAGLLVAELSRW